MVVPVTATAGCPRCVVYITTCLVSDDQSHKREAAASSSSSPGALIITLEHYHAANDNVRRHGGGSGTLVTIPFCCHSRAAFVENLVIRPPIDMHNTAERQ